MNLYNVIEIEGIKMAVCNIENRGLNSRDSLLSSISYLRWKYELTGEKEYLFKTISHIYAYLELGFPYERGKQEFLKVTSYLDIDIDYIFPEQKWRNQKILLTKTNIRNLLGRWNPGLHCMKISDVVEDIIEKVQNRQEGEYLYHSGKILTQEGSETLWENTFKLYIEENEAILQDVNRQKYYELERKENDKNCSRRR